MFCLIYLDRTKNVLVIQRPNSKKKVNNPSPRKYSINQRIEYYDKGLFYRAADEASEVLTLKRVRKLNHSLSKHGLETPLKSLFYLFVHVYAVLCTVHGQ